VNIYLDIDGVLRANDLSAALYADEFLQAVLAKYPDTTYWLTTHYWLGQDTTRLVLEPILKSKTIGLLGHIKPTKWGDYKTDGIDFSQPFLWFDDDLFAEERDALERHDVLDSHVLVDLDHNPKQLQQLIDRYLQ
jgi:hypothetical protein